MRTRLRKVIEWIKNKELAKKLVMIYFVLIVVPLSIMIYFTLTIFADKLEQKVGDYQLQTLKQLTLRMDAYMEELDRLTLMPYQYEDIITFLNSKREHNQPLTLQEIKDLNSFVTQVFLNGRIDIVGVSLYGEYGASYVVLPESQYVTSYSMDDNVTWLQQESSGDGRSIFAATHNIETVNGIQYPVFSIARELRVFDSGKKLGYIVIDVNPKFIQQILSEVTLGDREEIFVTTTEEELVAVKQKDTMLGELSGLWQLEELEGVTHADLEGERQQIAYVTSSITNWKTVGIVPVTELTKETVLIRNTLLIIGAACVVLAILFSTFLAYRITEPLRSLSKLMRKVERGDLLVTFPVKQWDEVGHLGHTFNMMVSRLSELGYLLYETEIREKDAQITALQSKINPHFLYNTLGSISMYAEIKGNREVVTMTNTLSRLLRYSLNGRKEWVSLHDELNHVKGYMTIQQMRYEDRITFQLDVDDELMDCEVIPLIIQPIVENAINHGIDRGKGYGAINLICRRDHNKLVVTVTDDGIGILEEELSRLQWKLKHSKDIGGSFGNGLLNVHRRIVLHYGETYGLVLQNIEPSGLKVTISLPITTKKISQ
ncbi:cache domain-containing sensor histidine kinase [Paenibacillus endoradicis]|uniref:cache domain-containing sensor histidine kinase n=1 Tax=Paenibacillus endoradicis TaxID=2972487 RepID=UPI002158B482|nr:sensor histidine kinase [Paenibacillus endoradicis]MCR8655727.1 sensor histidine kinase [Paenibacillus endoradicis]MCR8658053.1 sensor histidine kinase [Paenibacillus endoradicis]